MSIPIIGESRQFSGLTWAVRLSPLLVATILAALWLAGARASIPDLRLSAPQVAQPGTTIGLRAWQVDEDEHGYTVITAPEVSVELHDASGLILAETQLEKSKVQGREGELQIPPGLDEASSLLARATIDGQTVSVERALYVQEGIESRRPKGRTVTAFQVYELGPVRPADSKRGVEQLDPRIEEGACVPDLRCTLLIWVAEAHARVRVRSLAGVRVPSELRTPSRGFVRFPLQVSGSEGRVEVALIAEDGSLLATREARLPLVPGGIVARASEDDGSIRVDWEQLGEATPVLVDLFRGRRWVHALSLSPEDPYLPALDPGVWRAQVRADLFSDNTAGVSYFIVADPEGPARPYQAADAVLSEADRMGLDPLAVAIINHGVPDIGSPDLERALFAVPSFDVVSTGAGVSARLGVDAALEHAQERRRWAAAAAIFLIGLLVSMALLRVEVLAQARARRLLEDLGNGESPHAGKPGSGRGLWAFVLLVFALIAVLALSKGWF